MDFFKFFKRVGNLAAVFFTLYITYQLGLSPLFSYFGITLPAQAQGIPESLGTIAMWLAILSLALILTVLGIGYLVFTGWRYRRGIPWPFKVIIALVLGILVFSFAAPISMLVKIPLVPTITSVVLLWIALRTTSKYVGPIAKTVSAEQAVQIARQLHTSVIGSAEAEVTELILDKTDWRVRVRYKVNEEERMVEYKIDLQSGEVKGWQVAEK